MSTDYREPPASDPVATDEAADAADADADAERRSAVVDVALHGARLDKAVVAMAPEFSRSHLQQLIAGGHVQLDGVAATLAARKVRAGQRIELELIPTAESRAFRAEALPLAIVHEDDHVLVVDKPVGLVVHPAAGHWSGTLLNALLAHHPGAATLPRAGIVHRLDKDTSGLMVVGKTLVAVTALSRAIAAREVHRQYLALAHGEMAVGEFSVDKPIGRDPRSRVRMAVLGSGRAARTDVEVLASADRVSALRCTLHTGRTHQIRVHLASLGHPLVGDVLYGGEARGGVLRQALHAQRLAFVHPESGKELTFTAALPADLAAAWEAVAAGAQRRPVG